LTVWNYVVAWGNLHAHLCFQLVPVTYRLNVEQQSGGGCEHME